MGIAPGNLGKGRYTVCIANGLFFEPFCTSGITATEATGIAVSVRMFEIKLGKDFLDSVGSQKKKTAAL